MIDIREPEEIAIAVKRYKAKTIFISNSRAQNSAAHMNFNESDLNVGRYDYDYIIKNDGTVNDFRANIKAFAEHISFPSRCEHCVYKDKETFEIFKNLFSMIPNFNEEKSGALLDLLYKLFGEASE